MVHKDIAQNRQLTVDRRNLAEGRLERCAKALQRGGGVKLGNLELDLVAYKLTFEIWHGQRVLVDEPPKRGNARGRLGDVQCSCFPVRTIFSLSIERAPIAGDTVFVAIAGILLGGGVVLEMRGLLIKNKKKI